MRDPRDIYQENLDEVAVRLWARDFDAVCDLMFVPSRMVTEDGTAWIGDTAAIRRQLAQYVKLLDGLGAEGYHRLCLHAAYADGDEDRITGRHRTFVLKGGKHVIEPYESEMQLRLTPDGWKAAGLRLLGTNAGLPIIDPADFRERISTSEEDP